MEGGVERPLSFWLHIRRKCVCWVQHNGEMQMAAQEFTSDEHAEAFYAAADAEAIAAFEAHQAEEEAAAKAKTFREKEK